MAVAVAVVGCGAALAVTSLGSDGDEGSARTATHDRPRDQRAVELAQQSGYGDPAEVDLPKVSSDARKWLDGDGTPAVALVRATDGLWRDGAGACPSTEEELQRAGTPEQVKAAAAATPDEATSEILVDLHATVVAVLRACEDGPSFSAALPALAWQWLLADRRLDEIGVAR
jgi:hypothetical protein